MEVQIDPDRLLSRLLALQNRWLASKSGLFNGADALAIPMGVTSDDELTYSKAAALHLYLLGYEFSDTLIILMKGTCYFIATSKKCNLISTAVQQKPNAEMKIELLVKSKEDSVNIDQFTMILNAIKKQSGTKLGGLPKMECKGNFISLWNSTVAQAQLEVVDVSNALGVFFATKDENELVIASSYFSR